VSAFAIGASTGSSRRGRDGETVPCSRQHVAMRGHGLWRRSATQCSIVGGGPAGLTLGYLLARAGIDVVIIEKHADFLRDFRGDTIHPSTTELMHDLGLLPEFLELPHQRVPRLFAQFGPERVQIADFSRLPVRAPFIAMMPQWDFLFFLATKAKAHPSFRLIMNAEGWGLLTEDGGISGVRAETGEGAIDIRAPLTVAADGRGSRLRADAGLKVKDLGAPIDVLWFRLSRRASDTEETQGRFDRTGLHHAQSRRLLAVRLRGSQEQLRDKEGGGDCRFSRGAGKSRTVRARSRRRAGELGPDEGPERAGEPARDLVAAGLLCIGDAAHAMSPGGGVGVNLAVQDAVAAANLLATSLRRSTLANSDLSAVQRRREWPTRVTQRLQVLIQNRMF
jgi:2-polyprenyl-6-methoxyphenol hydroxylase-like FAD-dependent oxidoreductase